MLITPFSSLRLADYGGMATAPLPPSHRPLGLRGNYAAADDRYLVDPAQVGHTATDRAVWRRLFVRQAAAVRGAAALEFLAGLERLKFAADTLPCLERTSDRLRRLTGWTLVGVPGLLPEAVFFGHLAERRFPVTVWMRSPDECDYLAEPDFFHDLFGHVPLLTDQTFAAFVHAFGQRGVELNSRDSGGLKVLARLYWYTVEFGLMRSEAGLRAFGAGILSSSGETAYALASARPVRRAFELARVLRTEYLIDEYQRGYFVLRDFDQLFDAVLDDGFIGHCAVAARLPAYRPGD